MAGSDRDLKLDLLVFAPLPRRTSEGRLHQRGVSLYYEDLLPRLAGLGHRVRVIEEAPTGTGSAARSVLEGGGGVEVDPRPFAYRSGRLPADRAWRAALARELGSRLQEAVSARRPDCVLIGREILAPVLVASCRRAGLPVVVVAHGPTLAAIEEDDYPEEARDAIVAGLREADAVIAVAEHLGRSLQGLGVERAAAVRNGADVERFRLRPRDCARLAALGIDPDRVVVAQVSGLKPSKRPLDVVRAAALARGEDRLVHLVVGGGEHRSVVEDAVRREGLEERFRFLSEIDHDEMPALLCLADLVVVASEHEGLPLSFGEARACGRVVVSSDIPAAREAIVDGETGVLFRMGDPDDLAAKLVALARSPETRRRIGHRSRVEAERWTTEHAARAVAACLHAVVGDPRRASAL